MEGNCCPASSPCFLRDPRTSAQGRNHPPTMGWALLHWPLIEMLSYSWFSSRHFLKRGSFLMTLVVASWQENRQCTGEATDWPKCKAEELVAELGLICLICIEEWTLTLIHQKTTKWAIFTSYVRLKVPWLWPETFSLRSLSFRFLVSRAQSLVFICMISHVLEIVMVDWFLDGLGHLPPINFQKLDLWAVTYSSRMQNTDMTNLSSFADEIEGQGLWGCPVVKSIACSSRRLGFHPQHPHGNSHLSVAPVPGSPSCSDCGSMVVHRFTSLTRFGFSKLEAFI